MLAVNGPDAELTYSDECFALFQQFDRDESGEVSTLELRTML